jgi:hypothetical protein
MVAVISFVISGLLFGAIIGISWYGERSLPPGARIPLHYGLGSYNNFASKTTGLIVWPVGAAVVFAILGATAGHLVKANHGGGSVTPLILMPVALAVLAVAQWGQSRSPEGTLPAARISESPPGATGK